MSVSDSSDDSPLAFLLEELQLANRQFQQIYQLVTDPEAEFDIKSLRLLLDLNCD